MRNRMWLTGLSAGSLVLAGLIVAGPVTGSARQETTPAAQTEASQTSGATGQENGAQIVGTPLLQPAIDLMRAQEIALEGQSGAVVTQVDLDGDDGVLAYSVALDTGIEVEIDAASGDVLKTEQQEDDDENGNSNGHEDDADDDEAENESESESEQG